MVKPGFLGAPDILAWLAGVQPAWTALEFESFNLLRREPDEPDIAVRFSDAVSSPIAQNTMRFLSRLIDGTKLTVTGNLTRAFVAEVLDELDWPDFDREEMFRLHKVINEPDCLPLHAMRIFCDRGGLVRVYKKQLRLTKAGKQLVSSGDLGELNRTLFLATFWNTNLAYFDGLPLGPWPQSDIGVALWCLSVAGHQWQTPAHLVRTATIPINGIIEAAGSRDIAGPIFEARVLRQLSWFGLLDVETQPDPVYGFLKRRRYRKSSSFDQFLSFDVRLEGQDRLH
ncbi:hypothetical protein [Aurantimonas coralicida]|uniref:hypothetical protein n=1 Tax=Aurantimonas coralicida TaxID=182270 RepID=UPI001D18D0CB|nr:hypothetical protein [Aurantimonas coralicida]MCC4298323.1 hypothetical protein [Aurantimonas coralicida]